MARISTHTDYDWKRTHSRVMTKSGKNRKNSIFWDKPTWYPMYDSPLVVSDFSYLRVWAARAPNWVYVERQVVRQRVGVTGSVPVLSPKEIAVLRPREPFFPCVMYPLDDRAASDLRYFQQIRYGRTVPERVHWPSAFDVNAQVVFHPLMTCKLNKNTNRVKNTYVRRRYP